MKNKTNMDIHSSLSKRRIGRQQHFVTVWLCFSAWKVLGHELFRFSKHFCDRLSKGLSYFSYSEFETMFEVEILIIKNDSEVFEGYTRKNEKWKN